MASATDYLETQLGNHILRAGSFTKPTALYLALFTTKPDDAGANGVEVSAGGYARVPCGPSDEAWAEPSDGSGEFVNLVDFTFGSPTEDWGVDPMFITAFGIYDAETDGNLLITEDLIVPQEVFNGGLPPKFAAGDLKITFG
mgnify:CR=1 FL=1